MGCLSAWRALLVWLAALLVAVGVRVATGFRALPLAKLTVGRPIFTIAARAGAFLAREQPLPFRAQSKEGQPFLPGAVPTRQSTQPVLR